MPDTARPLIIAHRGESHDAPENTLAAIQLAWERNVPAVEIDVRLSSDKVPVAIHNATTGELTGRNLQVNRHTFSALRELDFGTHKGTAFKGELMPSLPEVLSTIPDGGCLLIEIKDGLETIDPLRLAIDKAGCPPHACLLIGFDPEVVTAAKKALPKFGTAWIIDIRKHRSSNPDEFARDLARRAQTTNAQCINLGLDESTDLRVVPALKHLGLKVFAWTVNDLALARKLIAVDIDGITSDRAAWLMKEIAAGSP